MLLSFAEGDVFKQDLIDRHFCDYTKNFILWKVIVHFINRSVTQKIDYSNLYRQKLL